MPSNEPAVKHHITTGAVLWASGAKARGGSVRPASIPMYACRRMQSQHALQRCPGLLRWTEQGFEVAEERGSVRLHRQVRLPEPSSTISNPFFAKS